MVGKLQVAPNGSPLFIGNLWGIWIPQTLLSSRSLRSPLEEFHMWCEGCTSVQSSQALPKPEDLAGDLDPKMLARKNPSEKMLSPWICGAVAGKCWYPTVKRHSPSYRVGYLADLAIECQKDLTHWGDSTHRRLRGWKRATRSQRQGSFLETSQGQMAA